MACSVQFLLMLPLLLLLHISKASSLSQNPILPKAAIFPVSKDPSTLEYIAHVSMGETLDPLDLVLDLNSPLLWTSSAVKSASPINSCSLKCSMAKSIRAFHGGSAAEYNPKTCTLLAENTISRNSAPGDLNEDTMAMEFWDGTNSPSYAKGVFGTLI